MSELEKIEGIGPKTKELLEKLNIYTIEDLINHYPFRYDVIRKSNLSEIKDGDKVISGELRNVCVIERRSVYIITGINDQNRILH